MNRLFHSTLYNGCNYLSMLGLKSIHVSKRDHETMAHFLSLAQSKLRLCSANHRPGYWSNLSCDWPSTAWAYSEQETENGPICGSCWLSIYWEQRRRMSIQPKIGWDTYMYMRSENNILKLCLSWRILVSGILIIQDLFSICYTWSHE